MAEGDKVVVVSGEFAGKVLLVGRVYPTLVELQSLGRDGNWHSFCSVTPAEAAAMTRPL